MSHDFGKLRYHDPNQVLLLNELPHRVKLFLEHFIAHSQVLFSEQNVDGHWVGKTSSCSKCSMTGLGDGVKRNCPITSAVGDYLQQDCQNSIHNYSFIQIFNLPLNSLSSSSNSFLFASFHATIFFEIPFV